MSEKIRKVINTLKVWQVTLLSAFHAVCKHILSLNDFFRMTFLYNVSIFFLMQLYAVAAGFNSKAKAFVQGRKIQKIKFNSTFPLPENDQVVWVHCASLGEFEQGRPVIEALRRQFAHHKILLTFFSPSGYEVRKHYDQADFIFYLPWDTHRNARHFVEKVKPSLVLFVKYEFWYHFTHELHKKNIPILSISSIFRPGQPFFKSYGSLFRSILKCFDHFFVQNLESAELLRSIGINQVTVSGDSRFDRVRQLTQQSEKISLAEQFKDSQKLMVVGSAWPEDMDVLYAFINESRGQLKFIVAPHEISEGFIRQIESAIQGKTIRYSKIQKESPSQFNVMIIDNVGMLSSLYRYGEFAFVGGGFNQGLHNILEPACFGIPIFFGNKSYSKFQEANDLILRGGAFEVGNFNDLKVAYELLNNHPESYLLACEVTRHYVLENLGATDKIIGYCKTILK